MALFICRSFLLLSLVLPGMGRKRVGFDLLFPFVRVRTFVVTLAVGPRLTELAPPHRRRERRLRQFLRHERLTVAMALAKAKRWKETSTKVHGHRRLPVLLGRGREFYRIPRRSWVWSTRVSRAPAVWLLHCRCTRCRSAWFWSD